MPPQLQLSLLNVPPAMDAIAALPRPQRQTVEVPFGLSAACHRLAIRCSHNRM